MRTSVVQEEVVVHELGVVGVLADFVGQLREVHTAKCGHRVCNAAVEHRWLVWKGDEAVTGR